MREREWIGKTLATATVFGFLVGALTSGPFVDRYEDLSISSVFRFSLQARKHGKTYT